MYRLLCAISEDDLAVKSLFDHMRNLGIVAAVFSAAVWKYHQAGQSIFYLDVLIAVILGVLGVFLFFVNQFHGVRKLRAAGHPDWVCQTVFHTYSMVAVTIVMSIVWRVA